MSALPPPPPPDQAGPLPVPRPSKWEPIERGWWSNHRYEKLTYTTPGNTEDFGIDWERLAVPLEATSDSSAVEEESSLSQEHPYTLSKYQIDKIVIDWACDSFEIDESYDRDWLYGGIRVNRADFLSVLGQAVPLGQSIASPSNSQQRPRPLGDAGKSTAEVSSPVPALEHRRRGRPPEPRDKLHKWLNDELEKDRAAFVRNPDTELAHMYCDEVLRIRDKDRLDKAVDVYRKRVGSWRDGMRCQKI